MRSFGRECDFGLIPLQNQTDLRVRLLPNGTIYSISSGDVMLNGFLANPLSGPVGRLCLRRHRNGRVETHDMVGGDSVSHWGHVSRSARWVGTWDTARYDCCLMLHETLPAWFWHVQVDDPADTYSYDAVLVQDIGLADRNALRLNEAYNSQYIDHTVVTDETWGPVVLSRQNLAQNDKHPWMLHGCVDGAAGYATDACDIFGPDTDGLHAETLPSRINQYEFACIALQSPKAAPGKPLATTFFTRFEADHPAPSSPDDMAMLPTEFPAFDGPPQQTAPRIATSVFPKTALQTLPLSPDDIDVTFGERRHEEHSPDGELWSFFHGNRRHAVLPGKLQHGRRRTGQVYRSGRSLLPDESTLSTTVYADGVFASQLAVGNTSFNRFLSVARDSLGLIRGSGLRMAVDDGDGWKLLQRPSLFDMGLTDCRWLYRHADGLIEVRCVFDADAPTVRYEVLQEGRCLPLLITAELAMGANEYDQGGTLDIDLACGVVLARPEPGGLLESTHPDACLALCLGQPNNTVFGGDDVLLEPYDGISRRWPYIGVRLPAHEASTFWFTASLNEYLSGRTALQQCDMTRTHAEMAGQAEEFWRDLGVAEQLAGGEGIGSILSDIRAWYVHDAVIHLSAPRGLEQYNGGAWGTRDVCQGPLELLLSAGQHDACREILLELFANQYRDGHWPQWFMLAPYDAIRTTDAHGDVAIWPLKALCDYLQATEDYGILDAKVRFAEQTTRSSKKQTLREHVARLLQYVEDQFIDATALIAYGEGDWNDSLQPADTSLRTKMVSAWTAELLYDTLRQWRNVLRQCANAAADDTDTLMQRIAADVNHHLIADDVIAGFGVQEKGGGFRLRMHPQDTDSGIAYRLLSMNRGILSELFTPEQATHHAGLIEQHLRFADGVRLMDTPPTYHGGLEQFFRRAESAACFSREIGLMYVHAHLRYAEAMAKLGRADDLLLALRQACPIALQAVVPNAAQRQSNTYFSSSDAAFLTRYDATDHFADLRSGNVAVHGGWRVYSSGGGIFAGLIKRCLLGLRVEFGRLVLDPVLPASLDGLEYRGRLCGQDIQVRYHVQQGSHTPRQVHLNRRAVPFDIDHSNPYRDGGAVLPLQDAMRRLAANTLLEIWL